MILHQFPPQLDIQIEQIDKTILIIITNKLLINIMIHLITPFFHNLIRILKQPLITRQPLTQIFVQIIVTPQQLLIRIHIYCKQTHNGTCLLKTKEHLIQPLYKILLGDLKTLHFHIYQLTHYIK